MALLAQARLAARNAVSLDTVLRRYFAGYTLLGDFLVEEAEAAGLPRDAELKRILRALAASFDRLVAAVAEEHAREGGERLGSSAEREAQRVERLLAGELLDTSQIPYDLAAHHTALLATGPGSLEAIRRLGAALDRRLLLICPRQGELRFAWLGGRHRLEPAELQAALAATLPPEVFLAAGEPAEGLSGWRLTHRQARAALPVALRGPERCVRYADVALLAAVLKDELLATSLRQMYLEPLEGGRDGGEVLRGTLRAYFAAEGNSAATAAALAITRQTVTNRLRYVEQRIGKQLRICAAELGVALRLVELGPRGEGQGGAFQRANI